VLTGLPVSLRALEFPYANVDDGVEEASDGGTDMTGDVEMDPGLDRTECTT